MTSALNDAAEVAALRERVAEVKPDTRRRAEADRLAAEVERLRPQPGRAPIEIADVQVGRAAKRQV